MFPLVEHIPKLLLASVIGFIIGAERAAQKNKKHVGVGTCSLICLFTCSLTIASKYMLGNGVDSSRLISTIISAVSFLCGGVIFVKSADSTHDDIVVGLTTGAILFGLSSIGIIIGLGYWQFAITLTLLVFVNLAASKAFKQYHKKMNDNDNMPE